jgi:hypothetical protein
MSRNGSSTQPRAGLSCHLRYSETGCPRSWEYHSASFSPLRRWTIGTKTTITVSTERGLGMNPYIRDALRRAGAEAGRTARADAGLPAQVEDHQAVQRMAELLIKVGGRRDAA